MKKYCVDNYGNISIADAQWDQLDKRWMYNPERESFVDPGTPPDRKRFTIKDGLWETADIDPHHKKLESGQIVDKSALELMRDIPKEFPIPKGMKLVISEINERNPIGLILEEKTAEEKYKDGELTKEEANSILMLECDMKRQARYVQESDPLFFKWQRGENGVTKKEWISAIKQIKKEIPEPKLFI